MLAQSAVGAKRGWRKRDWRKRDWRERDTTRSYDGRFLKLDYYKIA
jgi:hypothetical protein